MFRAGQLIYSKCALEGWIRQTRPVEPGAESDRLSPRDLVEVATWVMIPAWTPLIVLGPSTVHAGKEYYRALLANGRTLPDSRPHYSSHISTSNLVYVSAPELESSGLGA